MRHAKERWKEGGREIREEGIITIGGILKLSYRVGGVDATV